MTFGLSLYKVLLSRHIRPEISNPCDCFTQIVSKISVCTNAVKMSVCSTFKSYIIANINNTFHIITLIILKNISSYSIFSIYLNFSVIHRFFHRKIFFFNSSFIVMIHFFDKICALFDGFFNVLVLFLMWALNSTFNVLWIFGQNFEFFTSSYVSKTKKFANCVFNVRNAKLFKNWLNFRFNKSVNLS